MAELTFTTNGAAAVTKATDKISGEMARMGKLAVDIEKRYTSAFDKYKDKLGAATRALANHADKEKLLRAETTRLTIEYLKQGDVGKRTSVQQEQMSRRVATAQKELNRELAKLPPLFSQSELQLRKMDNTFTGTIPEWEKSLGGVQKATNKTFGEEGLGLVDGFGARILSLLAPIGLVNTGIARITERLREALAVAQSTAKTEGSLKQLAKGATPQEAQADFDRMLRYVDSLQGGGAVGSRQEALDLVFALSSADRLNPRDVRFYAGLGKAQFDPDMPGLVKSAQTIVASFGRGETGSDRQIFSKAARGAAKSPGTFGEYLQATSRVGVASRFEGLRDEEAFASTAVLANAIGRPDEAATALEALIYATAEMPEMAGLNLEERVKNIRARKLGSAGLLKLLGRKEAVRGFGLMAGNLGEYRRDLGAIERANVDTSALDAKLAIKAPIADTVRLIETIEQRQQRLNFAQGTAQGLVDQVDDRLGAMYSSNARDLAGGGVVGGIAAGAVQGLASLGSWIGNFRPPLETLELAEQRGELTPAEREQFQELKKQNSLMLEQNRILEKQQRTMESIDGKMDKGGLVAGRR